MYVYVTLYAFIILCDNVSHMLLVEDLTQSLIMIQPILYAYSFSGPPEVCYYMYVAILDNLYHFIANCTCSL